MAWQGDVSHDEKVQVLEAIDRLEHCEHIAYMSHKTIANATNVLKPSAVRWVIDALNKEHLITTLRVGTGKVPRYFYRVTQAGKELIK